MVLTRSLISAVVAAVLVGGRTETLHGRRSCDANDLTEIVGYTALESTNVSGEFEGADFDKVVKLDNGMIFGFSEYNYAYAYRPDVIIFARKATVSGRDLIVYKLLIDDELYDARRER